MQGPYPWSNLDEWLINKYIGADLQVSKAGTSTWMPLGDLLARRRRGEGKPTGSPPAAGATVAGEVPPPPPGGGAPPAGAPPPPAAAPSKPRSSRYPESLDDRIARMQREGKLAHLDAYIKRGARPADASGGLIRAMGGSDSPASHRAGSDSPAPDRSDRPAPPEDLGARGGDAKKRRRGESFGPGESAAASDKKRGKSPMVEAEDFRAGGYAQLPVFEPKEPVKVPAKLPGAKAREKDPRTRRRRDGSAAPGGPDDPKPLDLPLPGWGVEDAIKARGEKRKTPGSSAPGFDSGGPRPAAGPKKAEDDEKDASDAPSWSELPGTREDPGVVQSAGGPGARDASLVKEELEEGGKADVPSSSSGEKNKGGKGGGERNGSDGSGVERRGGEKGEKDRDGDEKWVVPDPKENWRWTRPTTIDAARIEAHASRVVVRNAADDRFRVVCPAGAPGYGEALRGAALETSRPERAEKQRMSLDELTKRVGGGVKAEGYDPRAAFLAKARAKAEAEKAGEKGEKAGEEGEKKGAKAEGDSDRAAKAEPKTVTMTPSAQQERTCARTMAALHDAAMKNRKRLFFDLIKGPLEEWRAGAKEKE